MPKNLAVKGVILTHHLKALDWREWGARFMARVPEEVVEDVLRTLAAILNIPELD